MNKKFQPNTHHLPSTNFKMNRVLNWSYAIKKIFLNVCSLLWLKVFPDLSNKVCLCCGPHGASIRDDFIIIVYEECHNLVPAHIVINNVCLVMLEG